MTAQRQIFLHGPLGQRHLKEVLSAQMAGLFLRPKRIWLVSPWISDFPVLDNRTGDWDTLEPSWGNREIGFLELLASAVNNGCPLRLVTQNDGKSLSFINQLQNRLLSCADYKYLASDTLHTKGLLTRHFFLRGSMNYTYHGARLNDEILELTNDGTIISEALLEFENRYQFEDAQ
jgi:phosphatidylserine/phosphatidylglycerophosphate/cardiolipin synthase-like enzyme